MEDPGIGISPQFFCSDFCKSCPLYPDRLAKIDLSEYIQSHYILISSEFAIFVDGNKVSLQHVSTRSTAFSLYMSPKRMGLSYCHQLRSESKPLVTFHYTVYWLVKIRILIKAYCNPNITFHNCIVFASPNPTNQGELITVRLVLARRTT